MIKKLILFFIASMTLLAVGFSATVVLTDCNTLPTDNTRYVLDPSFTIGSGACFNVAGKHDVIIDGNKNIFDTLDITFSTTSSTKAITLQNITINSLQFTLSYDGSTVVNGINIKNVFAKNQERGVFQTTSPDNSGTRTFSNIVISNSKFIFYSGGSLMHTTGIGAIYNRNFVTALTNVTISYSDFIGGSYFGSNLCSGSMICSGRLDGNLVLTNNVFAFGSNGDTLGITTPTSCIINNNYWTENVIDTNNNGVSDNTFNAVSGSCTIYSGTLPSYSRLKSTFKTKAVEDYTYKEYVLNYVPAFSASIFLTMGSESYIYFTKLGTTNSSQNFQLSQVSPLILSFETLNGQNALQMNGYRGIVLGDRVSVYGGIKSKPIFTIGNNFFCNWNDSVGINVNAQKTNEIISTFKNNKIENFQINMPSTSSCYVLIKASTSDASEKLTLAHNSLLMTTVPSKASIPLIYLRGDKNTIYDNTISLNGQQGTKNKFIFAGQGGYNGGNRVYNNSFIGGGQVFTAFTETYYTVWLNKTASYIPSQYYMNNFNKVGAVYSYPLQNESQIQDFSFNSNFGNQYFNGTYTYSNGCDFYWFNLGNYYQKAKDGVWNNATQCSVDSDNDALCDREQAIGQFDMFYPVGRVQLYNASQQDDLCNAMLYADAHYQPFVGDEWSIFNAGIYYISQGYLTLFPGCRLSGIPIRDAVYETNYIFAIDKKPLFQYPFPASTQISNNIRQEYTCINFNWNIVSPVEDKKDYTSAVTTSWSYDSGDVNNLYCSETLNGFEVLLPSTVPKNTVQSLAWAGLTSGKYVWKVQCCKDKTCLGIKQNTTRTFCVNNNCNISPTVTIAPIIPVSKYGCTNPTATNYDNTATVNDGSCIFPPITPPSPPGIIQAPFFNTTGTLITSNPIETFNNVKNIAGGIFSPLIIIFLIIVGIFIIAGVIGLIISMVTW